MEEIEPIKFATFKPLTLSDTAGVDRIRDYYTDNQLNPDNDYLSRYLGMNTDSKKENLNTSKFTSKSVDISAILSDIDRSTNVPTQPQAQTNYIPSGKKVNDAMNFFVSKGLSKEQAAGIVGNLQSESRLNPTQIGDKNLKTSSEGIAQWRENRLSNLKNYAGTKGKPYTDFGTQLEFLWNELNSSENTALKELMKTKTPTDAARSFANHFERMKKYNKEREDNANNFYRQS